MAAAGGMYDGNAVVPTSEQSGRLIGETKTKKAGTITRRKVRQHLQPRTEGELAAI